MDFGQPQTFLHSLNIRTHSTHTDVKAEFPSHLNWWINSFYGRAAARISCSWKRRTERAVEIGKITGDKIHPSRQAALSQWLTNTKCAGHHNLSTRTCSNMKRKVAVWWNMTDWWNLEIGGWSERETMCWRECWCLRCLLIKQEISRYQIKQISGYQVQHQRFCEATQYFNGNIGRGTVGDQSSSGEAPKWIQALNNQEDTGSYWEATQQKFKLKFYMEKTFSSCSTIFIPLRTGFSPCSLPTEKSLRRALLQISPLTVMTSVWRSHQSRHF